MDIVYKSKVDKWFPWTICICVIALIGSIHLCYKSTWVLLIDVIFVGICILMMIDILLHTDYTIRGDKLHIRCGILYRQTIPVSKITEIIHKSTILSSPALSSKRIGLRYGRTNIVYVSPSNLPSFIAHLQHLNPAIQNPAIQTT